jgi:hypothetical protein
MGLRKLLASVIALGTLGGCYGTTTATYRTSGYVVAEVPAPREEIVLYRPGYIWVHGRWVQRDGRWAWRGGYYERERPNHIYVQGYWERRGPRRVWVDGGWQTTGRVVVRGR